MLQKAKEFANEVRSLGGALLGALEKQDAEDLSQLRSAHELALQKRILEIKKERLNEVLETHKSLEKSIFSAIDRRDYYQGLIDQGLLPQEQQEVQLIEWANREMDSADTANALASILSIIPQLGTNGPIPAFKVGGLNFGNAIKAIGDLHSINAGKLNRMASMLARDVSIERREMEWNMQLKQVERELERLEKDQIASEIRIAIAEKEIAHQQQQIEDSAEAELFLKDKFTNSQLYGWMTSQLAGLHYQAYQLALDMARQAQASMQFELDDVQQSFIGFDYWDSLKKGLLSGERLVQDLNKMDAHYLANNQRKLELSKQISLSRLNALALLDLRNKGDCTFSLPEYIFDLDHAGHF